MRNGSKYMRPDSRGSKYPPVETNLHHCLTPRCHGKVNKKSAHSPYCCHCKFIRWRDKNPLRYSFGNLRRRAAQRKKDFSLTFEQYQDFAIKTDYARLKGKSSLSLSIDRKQNSRGYHADNIQAITLRENSLKQWVPYFANQMPNEAYQPTAEEIALNIRSLHKVFSQLNGDKATIYSGGDELTPITVQNEQVSVLAMPMRFK